MATSVDFIEYVCEQIKGIGSIRYRKMFGEYLIYVNELPLMVVCDNTVYVKKMACIEKMMRDKITGYPYQGAKEHYILDMEQVEFNKQILKELEQVIPLPKSKNKK